MTVDGQPWRRGPAGGGRWVTVGTPGLYILIASRRVGTALTYTGLELYNIGGPGTYDLGVSFTNFGGGFTFGDATGAWWTPPSGAAGSVTITTLTPRASPGRSRARSTR